MYVHNNVDNNGIMWYKERMTSRVYKAVSEVPELCFFVC